MRTPNPSRIGLYAWGGPDTIRLLKTKYHHPKIDIDSFNSLYSKKSLQSMKALFGITDIWVTYSWGFENETKQHRHIKQTLKLTKNLNINSFLYVQGWNVIENDFQHRDFFAIDKHGRRQKYSKGRLLTCPNNPHFVQHFLNRITAACQENCTGIFVDNILFGRPPFMKRNDLWTGAGCYCSYCQTQYQKIYHQPIPKQFLTSESITSYNTFRATSTFSLLHQAKKICKRFKKQFGVNFYDPISHDALYMYGYNLNQLAALVDYILIENFGLSFPEKNTAITMQLGQYHKPIFVVSYRHGIGVDQQWSQSDINKLFSQSEAENYAICLKVSEFITNNVWHTLRLQGLTPPTRGTLKTGSTKTRISRNASRWERSFAPLFDLMISYGSHIYFEYPLVNNIASFLKLESRILKKSIA